MSAPVVTPTMLKFGYKHTLIADYDWWCVLLRPTQPTLGSLILAAKSNTKAFSELPSSAFTELASVTKDIETSLKAFQDYDKINYLMLMMKDPEPHFHVIPRYKAAQQFTGLDFNDTGWPGPPALGDALPLNDDQRDELISAVKAHWPARSAVN